MSGTFPKTAMVLGATGGIGSRLAKRLAGGGTRLALAATDADRVRALAGELDAPGEGEHVAEAIDATDAGQVEAWIERTNKAFGSVGAVANCVGSIVLKPAHLTTDEEFERTLRLNLWSSIGVVRGAAKAMRQTGGSVVLFSTAAANAGIPNHEAIAAAKGAVQALALSASATYAPQGIRFNTIAPGLVNTPGAKAITGNEMAKKASEAMHALGRIGEPDEVASLAAWLISGDAGWVTGQNFGMDGGLSRIKTRVKM
ncbi:MAG: SDR family oxidoreductase [Phycisphaerales bacterium]|nr:MAG: SDR family oxidoreductase [Phycisphaerales bacterium]